MVPLSSIHTNPYAQTGAERDAGQGGEGVGQGHGASRIMDSIASISSPAQLHRAVRSCDPNVCTSNQWRWGEPATIPSVALTWVNGINYTSAEVEEQAHFLSTLFGCRVRGNVTFMDHRGSIDAILRRCVVYLITLDHDRLDPPPLLPPATGAAVLQPLAGVVAEGPDARELHVHPRPDGGPRGDGARQALVHGTYVRRCVLYLWAWVGFVRGGEGEGRPTDGAVGACI